VVPLGRELERHPDPCERGPQLVGDVGEQLALGADEPLQSLRHLVERAREVAHLARARSPARTERSPSPSRFAASVSRSSGDAMERAVG